MRWTPARVTVPPTFEPVTLGEAKDHLRIDTDQFDAGILGRLMAARAAVENRTELKLATQTVEFGAWCFDECHFYMPIGPMQSLESITYVDNDGDTQTLDEDVYSVSLSGLYPLLSLAFNQSWPSHRSGLGLITFTAVVGWPKGELPDDIRHAILLMLGDAESFRESATLGQASAIPSSMAVDSLLAPYRSWRV